MKTTRTAVRAIIAVCIVIAPPAARAEWTRAERGEAAVKNLTIVGTTLFCGDPSLLSRSPDGGETWQNLSAEFPEDGHLRDYMVSDGRFLFAMFYGFTYDALYRADAAGKGWKQVLKKDTKTLGRAFGLKGRVVLNNENGDGYQVSSDGGNTWSLTKGCLVDGKNMRTDFRIMVELGDTIYVARGEGPLIASSDGLKTFWTVKGPSGHELSLSQAGPFLLVGRNEYARGRHQFILEVSDDRGTTWRKADMEFENPVSVNRVSSGLAHGGVLYITTHGKVYRSRDRGLTWQDISENLLPFAIEADSRLFMKSGELGLMGSVFMWTRKID